MQGNKLFHVLVVGGAILGAIGGTLVAGKGTVAQASQSADGGGGAPDGGHRGVRGW